MSCRSATLDDLYRHHHSINNLMDTDLQSAKDNVVNTDKNQQISTKFDNEYHEGSDSASTVSSL